jgi:hypothetical protein
VLPRTVGSGRDGGGGGGLVRRAYAEHYASFTLNTVRTTFALDIPSDASPAFQVRIDDDDRFASSFLPLAPAAAVGGLEWKIRLCLLVGVAEAVGGDGVLFRSLERDGGRGEWGSSWCAPARFVPLQKKKGVGDGEEAGAGMGRGRSWTRVLVDSMWSAVTGVGAEEEGEGEEEVSRREKEEDVNRVREYDGIRPDLGGGIGRGVDFGGDDVRWEEVRLETVECEVPIKVWPGNTAFRAVDVVFDV